MEIVKGLTNFSACEDQEIILQVELNRSNQEVEWFRNGEKINSDLTQRFNNKDNLYSLKINSCDYLLHAGEYVFKVKDLDSKANVDVKGIFDY
jgi:hypothetical protein